MISNNTRSLRSLYLLNRAGILRRNASNELNIEKLETETEVDVEVDEQARLKEERLEKSRNKSRLYPPHRNRVLDQPAYTEPQMFHHGTLKYLRKTYAKYGSASGVNPAICWPTEQEIKDAIEYEKVAYPYTIPEMVAMAKKQQAEKEERIRARQEDIVKKVAKLDMWKKELNDKIAKKEQEANLAKQRKDRLIEEVRKHFGYTVDPRDEKFKEMLEKKEKEQKKALKEERKKMREAKMMDRLLKKGDSEKSNKEESPDTKAKEDVKSEN
ncbi:unnamed protein product [Callosobruchus maculatus]|uniref:Large ribosomal subunit protein mL64 n=1 Tax=Callosobruchus maculatus TaxID=64391 RepID=A0A653CPB8_CALMS|nr:unnamed protein product [Callosobruchus maculatus]